MTEQNKKNSLLIVDDDASNLMELTRILQPEYNIYMAKNGASALEKAQLNVPDLILLDVVMPDMNGFDVLKKLQVSEKTQIIPVIFITGINEDSNESAGLSIGAVDYIRKPFDSMVIKLRVRHQIQIINLRRDLEESAKTAEMASKTKSVFLANMSHEIRTPMNAILGITEIMLQNETLPEKIEEGLGKIYSSCDLLLSIINDILDFSKIEAGRMDIIPVQYKIVNLINDVVNLNMMRFDDKSIDFEINIDENIPVRFTGDELRIKQVLNNLLSNAFKYTDTGKVTLSVSFESGRKDEVLVLSVKDTGYGMTSEQVEKIFDEYSRIIHAKSGAIEGTGLGLSITQRLLKLMNGEIIVESTPGKGSIFTVKLPQKAADTEILGKDAALNLQQFRMNCMPQKKWKKINREPMPYGSVLLVDDVETNIYVAMGLMKLYKLQTETAMSGFEAIKKIKDGKVYDVIFMDHMMPEMDGIETVKHLRELGYKEPIVVLTANAVTGQEDMFLKNGFDDFISKPIDMRQLNSILNKLIRDKQPADVVEAARRQNENTNENLSGQPEFDSLLLDSFIRDAGKAIDWLGEQLKNITIENEDILRKFTVIVHGMKSSLWNVGEKKLGETAQKLEISGREKNIDHIKTVTPEFLNELRILLERLKLNKNVPDSGTEDKDLEDLCKKLLSIQKMCEDYNRKGSLDILTEMKNYSKKTMEVLENIKIHVLHSEFEKAEQAAKMHIAHLDK
ncbi:MAG: response regulator [Treponema sp.]|nr:response regulator [Treponema sp.]